MGSSIWKWITMDWLIIEAISRHNNKSCKTFPIMKFNSLLISTCDISNLPTLSFDRQRKTKKNKNNSSDSPLLTFVAINLWEPRIWFLISHITYSQINLKSLEKKKKKRIRKERKRGESSAHGGSEIAFKHHTKSWI